MRIPHFLQQFITPIVKASKGAQSLQFYSLPEYRNWLQANAQGRGWTIKYYKGLGTSTAQEAKEYFSQMSKHRKEFVWSGEADGDRMDMAFSKRRANERKTWLDEQYSVRVVCFFVWLNEFL